MATASFVTDLTEILTQVAEAAAGIASIVTGFKILSLARKYYDLYEEQREYYYETFQTGVELPLATESYADLPYVMDYVGRVESAYSTDTGPFGGAVTDAAGWWQRHGAAYNVPVNDARLSRELVVDLARIKTDWTNYLFRFEEQFYDATNDIRWRKRIALHNLGIKQGTAIAAAMDSALGEYVGHVQDFGNQLATYGNGIAKYVGYKKGLADTADDFRRMEYNQRVPTYDIERSSGTNKVVRHSAPI